MQNMQDFDFHENEEKQLWLSRGVIACKKQLERTHKRSDTSLDAVNAEDTSPENTADRV